MSNLYKGPSIDASYQVSVHLADGFQRRRLKCEKLIDDGRRMPKAHSLELAICTKKCIKIGCKIRNFNFFLNWQSLTPFDSVYIGNS
jgi:hypothetical protein